MAKQIYIYIIKNTHSHEHRQTDTHTRTHVYNVATNIENYINVCAQISCKWFN